MNWIFWIVVGGILLTAVIATASIFISKRRAQLQAARTAELEAPAEGELLDTAAPPQAMVVDAEVI
ncbi:MAG: hypothetical protein GX454_01605, partial [Brooklawnia sp.]|nr:hypothetical protein [Brooklawnia sp.]